jgi:ABC-type branched-subunit amino acid transport system substrate-binding protein
LTTMIGMRGPAGTALAGVLAAVLGLAGCVPAGPPAEAEPAVRGVVEGRATPEERQAAAALLTAARGELAAGRHAAARARALEVVERYPTTPESGQALWVAARAARALGEFAEAVRLAEQYAALAPPGSEPAVRGARLAAEARAELAAVRTPVTLGVLLPESGPAYLAQVAELLREGMQLAAAEHRERTGRPVELVFLDDAGSAEAGVRLLGELERRGAVAVVGPLLSEAVLAAARSRTDTALALISPTAMDAPPGQPNVFLLSETDLEGAGALAEHAVRSGLQRVAVLHARTRDAQRQADAFVAALARHGGTLATRIPFDSGTTTFAQQLRQLTAAHPQAVFIPATEREIRQLAPQLTFYGVLGAGVRVLGTEEWASEEVRRLVDPRHLEGVVAATPFLANAPELTWGAFVTRYEATYRRTLNSAFPALGYDAVRLALAGAPPGPAAAQGVASGIRGLGEHRGAAAVYQLAAGRALRRPFLVRIESGDLVRIDAAR